MKNAENKTVPQKNSEVSTTNILFTMSEWALLPYFKTEAGSESNSRQGPPVGIFRKQL
jgi:hypothetical protein